MKTATILIALKFLWSLIKGIIGAKSPKERNAQLEKQLEKLEKKKDEIDKKLEQAIYAGRGDLIRKLSADRRQLSKQISRVRARTRAEIH